VGAEAAHSHGEAIAADAFLVSDDGGLSAQAAQGTVTGGDALSVWLRGKGLFDAGRVDAAFRWRSPGFSDRDHRDPPQARLQVGHKPLVDREQRIGVSHRGRVDRPGYSWRRY